MSGYDDILGSLDRKDFLMLEEREPEIIAGIRKRLRKGDSPKEIGAYIRRQRPHKWPESKIIEAAAMYLAAGGE